MCLYCDVAVTKAQERKMEVAEMKMLRFSIGKTRLDRIRNEEVRRRLGVVELGHQLRETRMRWLGHITRREETYVGKRMRQMVVGKRKRGRPKRRWQDCIDDDLKGLGVREEDELDRRESGGELSAPATPETGNKAVEEEEDDCDVFILARNRSPRVDCLVL